MPGVYFPCGIAVSFLNGTSQQRSLFSSAVAESLFDWKRIPNNIDVDWGAQFDPNLHNSFAVTTYLSDQFDTCHRASHDRISIAADLDNPSRPGNEGGRPNGYYAGVDFYKETVIHEMGHVLGSMALGQSDIIQKICECFGRNASDWQAGLQNQGKWEDRVTEAFAEVFKDVSFPGRKFDNRTNLQLPESNYGKFLDQLDRICCCSPPSEQ